MTSLSKDKATVIAYSVIFLTLVNSCSTFFFWCMLECNMVSFILMCFFCQMYLLKMESFDLSFFYFMVQSLGSVFFLLCFFWVLSYNMSYMGELSIFPLLLKSGVFPFFSWVFTSIEFFSAFSLPLLLSIQKIPLYLFLFLSSSYLLMFFLALSMIFGSYFLFFSQSWAKLLLCSSLYMVLWVFGAFHFGLLFYSKFFISYSLFLFVFSLFYMYKFALGVTDFVTFAGSFLFFLGLPPMGMFFFKLYFVQWAMLFVPFYTFCLIWVFTFISLFGYFKFLFKGFLPSVQSYSSHGSPLGPLLAVSGLGALGFLTLFSSKLFKLLGSYPK